VEPKRVFSGCGRTVTKIRSSLHDKSVDLLTLLGGYLKTEKLIFNKKKTVKDCQKMRYKQRNLNLYLCIIFFHCFQLNLLRVKKVHENMSRDL
jgi:hypothetical protein